MLQNQGVYVVMVDISFALVGGLFVPSMVRAICHETISTNARNVPTFGKGD